ncbi:YciI family protein [Rhizobium oryziradicis]|uniref:GTP cyclohydrolase n=1 Tax=Rhizobium oryziradicis TaxID=1867956 RepID=A0A1Q8ZPT1_9HYPH|nr:YciI family protein [Rhizobium oryziradicis]OLP44067.1 GTP cyclohydrolase [Rhizobium oryziradicis]
MIILSLTYKADISQADAYMQPHLDWVKQGYERGWFLASGRKVPRTGGVILAKGDRAEIEAFVALDPFVIHAIADYDITEVVLSTVTDGLAALA